MWKRRPITMLIATPEQPDGRPRRPNITNGEQYSPRGQPNSACSTYDSRPPVNCWVWAVPVGGEVETTRHMYIYVRQLGSNLTYIGSALTSMRQDIGARWLPSLGVITHDNGDCDANCRTPIRYRPDLGDGHTTSASTREVAQIPALTEIGLRACGCCIDRW